MKLLRNGFLLVGLIVLVLAGVVVFRTLALKAPAETADASAISSAPAIDADTAAQHLSAAVKFQTVSHADKADDHPEILATHSRPGSPPPIRISTPLAARETVGEAGLIWTWQGSDPSLAPIILMAHQDVVPVSDDTRGEWKADPFGGEIKDGAVWGRGSIDDKGSLISLMEAGEALAAQGFKPKRTILIVSGHDEEVRGSGAQAAADALKARGVHALFALDEGSAIVADFPLTHGPAALIGISEKGYATLRVTAHGQGGHSSAPPKDTAVTTLSKAVVAIAGHPFPLEVKGPTAGMLDALAPRLPFATRMVIANRWLFGGVLTSQMGATPAGMSMLHTTIAPTMLQGSPKDNVLPDTAIARINYRIAPGQTPADIMAKAKAAVGALPVDLAFEGMGSDPSPVSSTTSEGWRDVSVAIRHISTAPIAPTLDTSATDVRRMVGVANDIYRFQPIVFHLRDLEMIHGVNEHMQIADLKRMADFYAYLMVKSAG